MIQLPVPVSGESARYPDVDAVRRFYDAVEREVRTIPGSARWPGGIMPLDGVWYGQYFAVVGDPPKPLASRDIANYQQVSPEYFNTLDVAIVAGRD